MISPAVFGLAAKSVANRRFTALLTIVSIALSVMLFVGVERLRTGAKTGFERTISGVHLVVGARSGAINLVLYTVFRLGDPTNNIRWSTYQEIAALPQVEWAVPLSLGDSHRGYRVVGTTTGFFEHYRYAGDRTLSFAAGAAFDDVFDAVVGAEVARALDYEVGDPIVLAHGVGAVSFAEHGDKPFRVAGVLAPTGTPVDRSVHVSLQGIEAIHVGWETGAPSPLARAMTADRVRALPLEPEAVTAVLVRLKSPTAVPGVQRALNTYRGEPLTAVLPGIALDQLWQIVGVVERALAAVSGFVVVVGLVGILTSILTSLAERRREMSILRAVGARPGDVFFLLIAEAAGLAALGAALGIALLYGGLALAATVIGARTGLVLVDLAPGLYDLAVVGVVAGLAALLAVFPAWRAFRASLADGLSVRL